MSSFEECVEVKVPARTAYNQWTQFESFPLFMPGVDRVEQHGDTMTHWVTSIGGIRREFDAHITDQVTDTRVSWVTVHGPSHRGVVRFTEIYPALTRVAVRIDFEPHGVVETAGDQLDLVRQRVRGDLQRFKAFIETRDRETGAWRGQIHHGVSTGDTRARTGHGRHRPHDPPAHRRAGAG